MKEFLILILFIYGTVVEPRSHDLGESRYEVLGEVSEEVIRSLG